jgi:hypothetical protein
MSKQVEFTGELILNDWQVIACFRHPDIFKLNIFQEEEGRDRIAVGLEMTKAQFMDLRNLLNAIVCAEQIII